MPPDAALPMAGDEALRAANRDRRDWISENERPDGTALDGLYSVDEYFEGYRGVYVCGRERYRERDTPSVRNKVALRALLSFIHRIRSGFCSPFWRRCSPNRVRHAPSRSSRPLQDD